MFSVFISMMTNDVKNLFVRLLVTCIFTFAKSKFNFFFFSFYHVVCFNIIKLQELYIYSRYQSFVNVCTSFSFP